MSTNLSSVILSIKNPAVRLAAITGLLILSACASTPEFNLTGVIHNKTPKQLVDQFATLRDNNILIGGTIINSINTKSGTQLEILAYPLDSNHYPRTENTTSGRFLAVNSGFLETVNFAPGRQVSLVGKLTNIVAGKIGEADYTYPNLEISQIYLWTQDSGNPNPNTSFHIGVGVLFRR